VSAAGALLAPEQALLLDRLAIGGISGVSPSAAGVRQTRARGMGLEFQDYRAYQPGDDPRAIDWTVEARLRQLVVRTSRAHGRIDVHVLIDASASMALGQPSKWSCASRLAAAVCYVANGHRDASGLASFASGVLTRLPPATGPAQLYRVLQLLDASAPKGQSAIAAALESYAAASRGPGLVVVISDFFEPGAAIPGLQHLLYRGLTPAVLQVVAAEEVAPELEGEGLVVDIEDNEAAGVSVDDGVVASYQRRLATHQALLHEFCIAHRCPRARIQSDMTFREQLAELLGCGLFSTAT
jgi:uncharacterized protein (DUF58 family)